MQHLHLIPVCKSRAVNTVLMKDQHDCPFCVTVSWSCILFIGTVHTGKRLSVVEHYLFWNSLLLQLLDFSQLICLKIEHHCITRERKEKKGFEKLCINCQQFRCLSLSWCRFSTRFCQLEEFFCGRSSQYKIVGTYIYIHNSFMGSKPCAFFLHIKRCIFFLKKFFF